MMLSLVNSNTDSTMTTVYYINRTSHECGVTTVTHHVVTELKENDYPVCQVTCGEGGDYSNYKDASFYVKRKGEAIINDCRPF